MRRLKDSPLNWANCLERDKTRKKNKSSTSREINTKLHHPLTLLVAQLHMRMQEGRWPVSPSQHLPPKGRWESQQWRWESWVWVTVGNISSGKALPRYEVLWIPSRAKHHVSVLNSFWSKLMCGLQRVEVVLPAVINISLYFFFFKS